MEDSDSEKPPSPVTNPQPNSSSDDGSPPPPSNPPTNSLADDHSSDSRNECPVKNIPSPPTTPPPEPEPEEEPEFVVPQPRRPKTVRRVIQAEKETAIQKRFDISKVDQAVVQSLTGLAEYASLVKNNERLLRSTPRMPAGKSAAVRKLEIERALKVTEEAIARLEADPYPEEARTARPKTARPPPTNTRRPFGRKV
jgi:hypothetical protein